MTAPEQGNAWRVRLQVRRGVWLTLPDTQDGAMELFERLQALLVSVGDGPGLVGFPFRSDGSTVSVRAREVVALELLGPRPAQAATSHELRPAPTREVFVPGSGTEWLRSLPAARCAGRTA